MIRLLCPTGITLIDVSSEEFLLGTTCDSHLAQRPSCLTGRDLHTHSLDDTIEIGHNCRRDHCWSPISDLVLWYSGPSSKFALEFVRHPVPN